MTPRERWRLFVTSDWFQRGVMACAIGINVAILLWPPHSRWDIVQVVAIAILIPAQVVSERRRRAHARWLAEMDARSSNPARDRALREWMRRRSPREWRTIIDWNLAMLTGERHRDDAPPIVRDYWELHDTWNEVDR